MGSSKNLSLSPLPFFLYFSLVAAIAAFGFDLFHMIYHLIDRPVLWQLPNVPAKFCTKLVTFLVPLSLFAVNKIWRRWLTVFFFALLSTASLSWAATGCQHARELLEKSGTSRDADEDLFGNLKLKPPHGSFPEDMDKVTWWGLFKPFEFWESPEFKAVWINPDGQEIANQKFRGTKCRLAKTSVHAENQPRSQFQPGMYQVIVTCGDYLIDKQSFAVLGTGGPPQSAADSPKKTGEGAMIWAKDKVKD